METTAVCACVLFIAQTCSIAQDTSSARSSDLRRPASTATPLNNFIPMNQRERLRYYWKSTFNGEGGLGSAAGAGLSQWRNAPSEWGQGIEGYAKRFGDSYAQHIMRGTIMYGASSVFHEDNRYFPSGDPAFGPRLRYAIASSFMARGDDGARRVSLSRLGGYLATAFISREWQPRANSGPQDALASFGSAMGAAAGFNVAREFLPKVFRRHK